MTYEEYLKTSLNESNTIPFFRVFDGVKILDTIDLYLSDDNRIFKEPDDGYNTPYVEITSFINEEDIIIEKYAGRIDKNLMPIYENDIILVNNNEIHVKFDKLNMSFNLPHGEMNESNTEIIGQNHIKN